MNHISEVMDSLKHSLCKKIMKCLTSVDRNGVILSADSHTRENNRFNHHYMMVIFYLSTKEYPHSSTLLTCDSSAITSTQPVSILCLSSNIQYHYSSTQGVVIVRVHIYIQAEERNLERCHN